MQRDLVRAVQLAMATFEESTGARTRPLAREALTAAQFAAVGLAGLAVDAALLRLMVGAGVEPAWARVVSLACAMHVTFVINGVVVFRCLTRRTCARQWLGYMTSNGVGNLCNYWVFVTLVSLHRPPASNLYVALGCGAFVAYLINFAGARLIAFGKPRLARS